MKKKKKTKEEIEADVKKMDNLYAAIGLDAEDLEPSNFDITKAYKDTAILFHPDKLGRPPTEEDREVWLYIQEAYDTLTDPVRKRRYDSTLPFDDSMPAADVVNDDNFFKLYDACFENNARFSEIKPVPTIGDINTPIDEVYKFYKFWDDFKTWREFTQFDEHDPTKANDRYEKRWMESQNAKEHKKYAKEERKRLMKLYSEAYERDPRIKAEIARENAEKEAAKNQKKLAKQQRW